MAETDLPPEREVKEFIFQQLCKFRVTAPQDVGKERIQHLATSSKYGLVFMAVTEGLKVVNTQDIINLDNEHSRERSKIIIQDLPTRAFVPINNPISHVALSCDDLTLAVACGVNGNIVMYMYDVRAFSQPNAKPDPFKMVRVNGSPTLSDISWNPEVANTILACTADGHVEMLEIDDNDIKIATLPTSTNAYCVCWSPKGKQFVVGKNDGTLAQYDKNMALRKIWPCPPILDSEAGQYKVIDVLWLSTYMFLVAYLPQSAEPADQPLVILITSSKEGKTTYANFEDICFGSGEERNAKYYMSLILKWDMAVIGSANATETTIVGKNLDDKVTWDHWILEDSGRAELPLTEKKCDSFPVGFSVSYYSTASDGSSDAASPLLLLLSTDGLLVPFYMKYSHTDAGVITAPPGQLTSEGERKGTPIINQKITAASTAPAIPPATNSFQFLNKPAISSAAAPSTTISQPFNLTSTPATAAPFGQVKTTSSFSFNNTITASSEPAKSIFGGTTTGFSFNTLNSSFGTKPTATSTSASAFSSATSGLVSGLPSFGTSQASSFSFSGSGNVTAPKANSTLSGGSMSNKISGFAGITPTTSVPAFGSGTFTTTNNTKTDNISGVSSSSKPSISTGIGFFSGAPASTTSAGAGISKPTAIGAMPSTTPNVPGQTVVISTLITPGQSSVDSLIHETSEMTFTESIIEEMAHFEKELQDLKRKSSSSTWEVGTKTEMQTIKQSTEKFSKFSKDFIELTKGQSIEVADQKAQCLDAYDRAEDCNVRKERNTDPRYLKLLWSRALDPASADALKKLQQQYQSIEQGIRDVDLILDTQWDSYQKRKNKRGRIHIPTNDVIYKALKSNHNLILGQRNKIDEIQEKLKHLQLYKSPLNHSFTDTLNSLNNSDSSEKSSRRSSLKSSPGGSVSPEKSAKLREMLMNRRVPRIKSTAPANLSMSKIIGNIQDSSINSTREISSPNASNSLNKNISFGQKPNQMGVAVNGDTVKVAAPTMPPSSFTGHAFIKRPYSGTEQNLVIPTNQNNPLIYGKCSDQFKVQLKPQLGTGFHGSLASRTSTKLVSPSAGQTSISQLSPAVLTAYVDNARQQGLPQQYEDVTPPSSSRTPNDEYDDYDDEDDDEEDDDDDDDEEDNEDDDEVEAGFGPAYSYSFKEGKTTPTGTPKINSGKQEVIGKNLFGTNIPFAGFAAGDQNKTSDKPELGHFGLGSKMFGASEQTKTSLINTSKGQFTFTQNSSSLSLGASGSSTSSISQGKPTSQSGFSLGPGLAGPSSSSTFSFTHGGSNLFSKEAVQDAAVSLSAFGKSPPSSQDDVSNSKGNPLNVQSHPTLMTLLSNDTDEPESNKTGSSGTSAAQPDVKKEDSIAQPKMVPSTSDSLNMIGKNFGQASTGSFSGSTETTPASSTPFNLFGANSSTRGILGSTAPGGLFGSLSSTGSESTGTTLASNAPVSLFGENFSTKGFLNTTTPGDIFGSSKPNPEPEITKVQKESGGPETSAASSSVVASSSVLATSTETKTAAGFGFGTMNIPTSEGFFGKPIATNLFGMTATSTTSCLPETTSTSSTSGGFFGDTQGTTSSTKTTQPATDEISGNKLTSEDLETTAESKLKVGGLFSSEESTVDSTTTSKTEEQVFSSVVQTVDSTSTTTTSIESANSKSSQGKATSSQKVEEVKSLVSDPNEKGEEIKFVTSSGFFGSSSLAITNPTTTAAGGLFSTTNATAPATTSGGLFGPTTTTTSAQGSPFGSAASFTGFSSSSTATGSVFGGAPSFGSGTVPSFGKSAATVFGNAPAANSTTTGGFGQASSFGSTASSTNSSFGAKTEPASLIFGSSSTGFGSTSGTSQKTGFEQSSVFGQTSASGFGQSTGSTAPVFGQSPTQSSTSGGFGGGSGNGVGSGGLFSGLGGQPSAEKANTNVFGATQTFGTNAQQASNLFGNSSSTSGFGRSGGFGGGGGGGSFSQSGTGGVSATGFAAAPPTPISGGFGGAPTFGSSSGFGGSPSFGVKPTFGSAPVFGSAASPGFGSNQTFGSTPSGGTNFSGFNSAGSPSFGSIAQTSDQPTFGSVGQATGGFGSQPTFGGPSFGGQQQPSFGSPNNGGFGNSSSFSSYR